MGYYSKYSLRVDPPELYDQVARALTDLGGYGEASATVFESDNWNGGDGCKWYSHDKDCIELSRRMPDVLIEVERLGEDYVYGDLNADICDHWRDTYKNGVCIDTTHLPSPLHVDAQGQNIDLRQVDDRYLRNIVRWSSRRCQVLRRRWDSPQGHTLQVLKHATPVTDYLKLMGMRSTLSAAVNECRRRGILPDAADLYVAWDRACSRGHVDPTTGEPLTIYHACAGPVRDGEERPVWIEHGPRDLVELWVGYGAHKAA